MTPGPTVLREHGSKPESGGGRSRGDSENDERERGGTDRNSGVCQPDSRKSRHRDATSPGQFDREYLPRERGKDKRKQKSFRRDNRMNQIDEELSLS